MKGFRVKIARTLSILISWAGFAFAFLGGYSQAGQITVNASSNSYWIANEGQWEGDFSFKCEVGTAVYYVTPKGMTVDFREYTRHVRTVGAQHAVPDLDVAPSLMGKNPRSDSVSVRGHVVQIHYVGGDETAKTQGEDKLSHYSNYFLGRDSCKWRSRVSHYQNVMVENVWPGIDVEYRADGRGVETVFHVKPGADVRQIQMEYLGSDAPLRLDSQGNLILETSLGEIKEKSPFAFQQNHRMQESVGARFQIIDGNRVGYVLDSYDSSKEVVIDPLLYGTYLGGGSTDYGGPITGAPDGGVYVAGNTYALSGFPTTPGAYDETGLYPGFRDFVCHFGPNGEFIASTLFGEIQTQQNPSTDGGATGLVFDVPRSGLWICGNAHPSWPLTPDALDTLIDALGDAFLLRLSADLSSIEYCTYVGGNSIDQTYAIAVDSIGRVYIGGETYSTDFPITADALFPQRRENDCFLWVFDPSVNEVIYSTYFGGSGVDFQMFALCVPRVGRVWLSGVTFSLDFPVSDNAYQSFHSDSTLSEGDAYVAMINIEDPTVEYCSYLGGDSREYILSLVEVDSFIFAAGRTFSQDFPHSQGSYDTIGPLPGQGSDGFVCRLNWISGDFTGTFIGVDYYQTINVRGEWVGDDNITIAGYTNSPSFPSTSGAFDSLLNHGEDGFGDAFAMKLDRDLTGIMYSTYLGGSHREEDIYAWVENCDSVWISGTTESFNLPVTPNAFQPGDNAFNSAFILHFAIDTTADTTGAAPIAPLPFEFELSAFPNPFNPTTTLSWNLPRASETEIMMHNLLGQEIERVNLRRLSAGAHEFEIRADEWPSGIYFATVLGDLKCTPFSGQSVV